MKYLHLNGVYVRSRIISKMVLGLSWRESWAKQRYLEEKQENVHPHAIREGFIAH